MSFLRDSRLTLWYANKFGGRVSKSNSQQDCDFTNFQSDEDRVLGKVNSMAIRDLVAYVQERQDQDPLVVGFERIPGGNPFKRERAYKCAIL